MKYVKRILGLPFFIMLNVIGIIFHLFKISYLFIKYGGEAMAYDRKTTPKTIADVYRRVAGFDRDFMCHDQLVDEASEEECVKRCVNQCEKCKSEML